MEPEYSSCPFGSLGRDGRRAVVGGNLFLGSVRIPFAEVWAVLTGGEASQPSWGYIVLESRLPQALVALLSGAALARFRA